MRLIVFGWLLLLGLGCASTSAPLSSTGTSEPGLSASANGRDDAPDVDFQLRERTVRFDTEGRQTIRTRLVYRVLAADPDDHWQTVSATWRPGLDERPVVEARIIAPDGTTATLDPATVVESAVKSELDDVFSDARLVSAPLPNIRPGALVEATITTSERRALMPWGVALTLPFVVLQPLGVDRLTVEAPASVPLQSVVQAMPERLTRSSADGLTRLTLERKNVAAFTLPERDTPAEHIELPRVVVSTGSSWNAVARGYGAAVAPRFVLTASLKQTAKATVANARTDAEKVASLLRWIRGEIRYTGLEVQDASIVPATPEEVARRRYGDCKDLSTLLISMLAEVGVDAKLALLSASSLPDVPEQLPGTGHFNHAIVYVPSTRQWVDPASRFAAPGQLDDAAQNRFALVISPTTQALVKTPIDVAANNTLTARYELTFARNGRGTLVRTFETTGLVFQHRRQGVFANQEEYRKNMLKSAKVVYGSTADGGVQVTTGQPLDFDRPFVERLEVPDSTWAITTIKDALAWVSTDAVLDAFPVKLRDVDDKRVRTREEKDEERRKKPMEVVPHVTEVVVVARPPQGYALDRLPESFEEQVGPVKLSFRAKEAAGAVTLTLRLDSGPRLYSPEDVELVSRELPVVLGRVERLLFKNRPLRLVEQGKVAEALAAARAMVAAEPKEPLAHLTLAHVLLQLHAVKEARDAARAAVALAPSMALPHRELGKLLLNDPLGRPLQRGFDRKAGEAELRKALSLDAEDEHTARWLVDSLLVGDDGTWLPTGHDFAPALAVLSDFREKHGTALDSLHAEVLFRAGKTKQLVEQAPQFELDEKGRAAWLAALIVEKGARRAHQEYTRNDALEGASGESLGLLLLSTRRYAAFTEFATLDAQRTGERPSKETELAFTLISRMKNVDASKLDPSDLRSLAARITQFQLAGDPSRLDALAASGGDPELRDRYARRLLTGRAVLDRLPFPREMVVDLLTAMMRVEKVASFGFADFVRLDSPEIPNLNVEFFATKTPQGWKLHSATWDPSVLADALASGAQADQLMRCIASTPVGKIPMVARALQATKANAADRVVLIAVLHAFGSRPADAIAPLQRALAERRPSRERIAFALALSNAFERLDRWADVDALATSLSADPELDDMSLFLHGVARRHLGRSGEQRAALEAALKQRPDDKALLEQLAIAAHFEGRHDLTQKARERLVELDHDVADNLTELAFSSVFTSVDARALERVEKARRLNKDGIAVQSTMAMLYAERGQVNETFQALEARMASATGAELGARSWFAIGRFAETLSLDRTAVDAYRRVVTEAGDADRLSELAKKRLVALGSVDLARK
jgi:transglutaminase-like putative cysteine protease/tetratricopeptide (TPR) repeat protein